MRLVLITVSAIALSGCTWFGGGAQSSAHGFNGQASAHCGPQGGYANGYNLQGYQGQAYQGGGCGPAGGYSVAGGQYAQQGAGYGAVGATGQGLTQVNGGNGYGYGYTAGYAQGYGAQTGVQGLRGGYGVTGYNGVSTYGQQVTTLGAAAPYGAAVGGQYAGAQYAGANVQTVQGAPIYVQQPYPVFTGGGGGFIGAAQPFGLEAGVGTSFALTGDLVGAKEAGPASDGLGSPDLTTGGVGGRVVSATEAVSYGDAFSEAVELGLAATYDVSPTTTVLGRVGYAEANGRSVNIGSVTEGGNTGDLIASFSDLETYTVEGGVRQYVGGFNNGLTGLRPYVGASAGFTYNNDVDVIQSSTAFANGADPAIQLIDSGWNPTASAVVGAEWQVANSVALGVESGIRWQDDYDTALPSEDRWSIPVRLRGRVSF